MKSIRVAALGLSMPIFLAVLLIGVDGNAQDRNRPVSLTPGLYIDLTEEFYRALKNEPSGGDRSYSNNNSEEYLRQIAVASKFMVETNLEILRRQDKIIELLESKAKRDDPGAKR